MLVASVALLHVLNNYAPVRQHWGDGVISQNRRHLFALVPPDPRIKAALTLTEKRSNAGRIPQLKSLKLLPGFSPELLRCSAQINGLARIAPTKDRALKYGSKNWLSEYFRPYLLPSHAGLTIRQFPLIATPSDAQRFARNPSAV
jgi:hypothetical protein